MYSLINQNIEQILDIFDPDMDVHSYVAILRDLRMSDVSKNEQFQAKYRRYWRLNAARLSEPFFRYYFELLEELKQCGNPDIEEVSRRLYEMPTHSDGRQSLQFSFSTKLVHVIDPSKPVYDVMVADFYFLPEPKPHWKFERKLNNLFESYRFLIREHKRVLRENLLQNSIIKFRDYFHVYDIYTDQKIIDSLIWKFVTLLRTGALRKGTLVYS